ncbi:expressed unknown protein [Seminavis robusta]|uniref:Uncharacterized protein n=1 Tax=Seminavis robusta TaxID=568900 RepID=A0A9N8EHE4_9STRA|nr:expressed unknown protein [Seminavis robusta]|eukprot:Sro953_g224200.1 n/a (463) ;mRNA; r:15568-16956
MKILSVTILALLSTTVSGLGETRQVLDDMSQYFEHTNYPDSLYEEFSTCMNKWGVERLEEAQDVAWREFVNYYFTGGTLSDPWGEPSTQGSQWLEQVQNKTAFMGDPYRPYEVRQRCNFVSNVAYYRSAVRVCDFKTWKVPVEDRIGMMQTFVAAGTGSAWAHGSETSVGSRFDTSSVALLITAAYQIAIRSTSASSQVLLTVSNNLQPTPFTELARDLANMPLNFSVPEWISYINSLQLVRRYRIVAVALIAFGCMTLLPFSLCETLVNDVLAPEFLRAAEEDFMINEYMPELKLLAERDDFPVGPFEGGISVFLKLVGAVSGLLWAFVFQERTLSFVSGLEGECFNLTSLGAASSPMVDLLTYLLHGVPNTEDRGFFTGGDRSSHPYPGSEFCNKDSSHALWHDRSADAVFELYAVVDDAEQVIIARNKRRRLEKAQNPNAESNMGGLRRLVGLEEMMDT